MKEIKKSNRICLRRVELSGHILSEKCLKKCLNLKSLWKKAFRVCELALIAAVKRRDKSCQLCGSTITLQADHAIVSRRHLSTFFEIGQMVLLCRKCHCSKSFGNYGLAWKVSEIVQRREGQNYVDYIINKSHKIKKWMIDELEDMTHYFNSKYNALL